MVDRCAKCHCMAGVLALVLLSGCRRPSDPIPPQAKADAAQNAAPSDAGKTERAQTKKAAGSNARPGQAGQPEPDDAAHNAKAAGGEADRPDQSPRRFRFLYSAAVTKLEPGTTARVWVPIAPTNADQKVDVVSIETPAEYRRGTEPAYGNELLYFEAQADQDGKIPLNVEYLVERRWLSPHGTPADGHENAQRFLIGSSLVPANGSVVEELFSDRARPQGTTLDVARSLYDRVELHMTYDKSGEGWGRGDALWACDSGRGNCSDFHSVFIAMCRDLEIPAKFEMGFPLPADQGQGEIAGYHCWAKFMDGDRWVGVDISEADKRPQLKEFFFGNLPPDRIMFTTERDLVLVPPQDAGPVNFLIYPYVEVDGKPYTQQERQFRYEDQDQGLDRREGPAAKAGTGRAGG